MTPKNLRRAAALLRAHAEGIRIAYRIGGAEWQWDGKKITEREVKAARAEHEEMLALAVQLYAEAKSGPRAKVLH